MTKYKLIKTATLSSIVACCAAASLSAMAANNNAVTKRKVPAAPVKKAMPAQPIAKIDSEKQQQENAVVINKLDKMAMQLKTISMQLELNKAKINLYKSQKTLAGLTNTPMAYGGKAPVESPLTSLKLNLIFNKNNKPTAQVSVQGNSFEVTQGQQIGSYGLKVKQLSLQNLVIENTANKQTRSLSLGGAMEQI